MAKKESFGEEKNRNESSELLAKTFDNPNLQTGSSGNAVETLRTALAKLGLRIIDDINAKRVHKPEAVYDALVAIFNAIK